MISHFKRKVRNACFILKPGMSGYVMILLLKKKAYNKALIFRQNLQTTIYSLVVFLRPKGFIRNPSLDNANTGLLQYYTKFAYRGDDEFSAASTWSDYWN